METKTEEWKPEKIIGGDDIKEIIVPFGQIQEKLVPGLHYPLPEGGKIPKPGNVTYTTTGVKTVTGIGFTPKYIEIKASLNSGAISDGYYYNGGVYCRYYFTGGGAGDASGNIGFSSYLENSGNATYTTTIVPNSDGFTINVATVAGGAITIMYTCYG